MSKTIKDRPSRFKYDNHDKDRENIAPFVWNQLPTTKPKKRKEIDFEWHWMNTPSWWTRMTMNRPQRRSAKLWERDVSKIPFKTEAIEMTKYFGISKESMAMLEDSDTPSVSRKPHVYYW